jgi:uncharacterized membrane protein
MVFAFIKKYFFDPIEEYSGYNPVNTVVYGIILLAVSFYLIYPFFKRRGIKFDWDFFKAVFPFILFGSTFRVFEEKTSAVFFFERSSNPLSFGYYVVSPGIYIAVGLLTIFLLVASIKIGKRLNKSPLKIFKLFGWLLALPIVFFHILHLTHPIEFLFVLATVIAIILALIVVFKFLNLRLLKDKLNIATLASQTTDGIATFTALTFFKSYSEQHVLSNLIIQNFSPAAFVLVKIALVLLIIYFVDKEVEDQTLKNFIKIFIIILGFAPGIRDTFSLGLTTLN